MIDQAILDKIALTDDLSALTNDERVAHYRAVCEALGLNMATKPFAYITFQNKLRLYAQRDCTDQLRRIYKVSIASLQARVESGLYIATVTAQDATGRTDAASGAVAIANLAGDALANATMKAETKAKRRVTLSLCGLGILDESESETIPGAKQVQVNLDTGELANGAARTSTTTPPPASSPPASPANSGPPRKQHRPPDAVPPQDAPPPQQQQPPRNRVPGKKITEPQRKRLFAITKGSGKSQDMLKEYLTTQWSVERTEDILMDDYEAICNWAAAPMEEGAQA